LPFFPTSGTGTPFVTTASPVGCIDIDVLLKPFGYFRWPITAIKTWQRNVSFAETFRISLRCAIWDGQGVAPHERRWRRLCMESSARTPRRRHLKLLVRPQVLACAQKKV